MLRRFLVTTSLVLLAGGVLHGDDRADTLRKDQKELEDDSYWIYNDLDKGIAEAKRTGKPLLVVFR